MFAHCNCALPWPPVSALRLLSVCFSAARRASKAAKSLLRARVSAIIVLCAPVTTGVVLPGAPWGTWRAAVVRSGILHPVGRWWGVAERRAGVVALSTCRA